MTAPFLTPLSPPKMLASGSPGNGPRTLRRIPTDLCAFLFIAFAVAGSFGAPGTPSRTEALQATPPPARTVGVSDGRIHIIPALSARSVKNGQLLTVTAVVRAAAGIERVEADMGGVETIQLESSRSPESPATQPGPARVFSARWMAHDLEEKVYPVVLRVTDRTGHTLEDRTLQFSDPVAGQTVPGSTDYALGEAPRVAAALAFGEEDLSCVVADPSGEYAWFGTNTAPGIVVKVALGSGGQPPTRVGAVTLEPGEDFVRCAVIDAAAGYAWFGLGTQPGRIVKIALGNDAEPPTRVAGLTLTPTDSEVLCGVINPAAGQAWFGTGTSPAGVVKVSLGAGANPPLRLSGTLLAGGENRLGCAIIDPAAGYAWFGTDTSPGRVVKVALGAGASAPARVGAVTLAPGESYLRSAVLRPGAGQAWFGTATSPGQVVRVALGLGAAPPTRLDALVLEEGEQDLLSVVADPTLTHAWFGAGGSPGRVVKVRLDDGATSTARVGAAVLEEGESVLTCAAMGPGGTHACFGSAEGRVVKVELGEGTEAPSRVAATTLHAGDGKYTCIVADEQAGHAWVGTTSGRVVKFALGNGQTPPARVSALTLPGPPRPLSCAAIDATKGYAWFATDTTPGQVAKVALGDGDASPTLVAFLTLPPGDDRPQCVVTDTASAYAWFGTATAPGRLVKVALGDGDTPPSHVATTPLEPGEDNLRCAVVYASEGLAWFGTGTSPGRVIKVALGEGPAAPARLGAVTLDQGENDLRSAAGDPTGTHAWFGTGTSPGRVVKVALGAGPSPPSRVEGVRLARGENDLRAALMDWNSRCAWFATFTSPGRLVRIALGEGSAPPERLGASLLGTNEARPSCAVMDPASGYGWLATTSIPGAIVQVDLRAVSPLRSVATLGAPIGEDYFRCAVVDPASGYAWFGTGTAPGIVVKVALGQGMAPAVRVGSVRLNAGEDALESAVIDPARGYAWFGTNTWPGRVVKVALGEGDTSPTRVAALTLAPGEDNLSCAVISPEAGYAWFGTRTMPGRVVKVGLGDGDTSPTRVGVVTFNANENDPTCAVIDPEGGYAWFGTYTRPGRVVKVALGAGASPPTRVGALSLSGGEDSLRCAVIDPEARRAWFATHTWPGRIVKINLGAGAALPTRLGSDILNAGEDKPACAVVDTAAGCAWFGTSTTPGHVIKVALGEGSAPPRRLGALTLGQGGDFLSSAVADPASGVALFGTSVFSPGAVVKVALSARDTIRAARVHITEPARINDVRFYSHVAAGNVRVSIYDDDAPKNLLWQSDSLINDAEASWLSVPVSSGVPSSLELAPGYYWLAFQCDSPLDVAGFTRASDGDGFILQQDYGPFPAQLHPGDLQLTRQRWSIHLTYEVLHSLVVRSDHGAPAPGVGSHSYTTGTMVSALMPEPFVQGPLGTRFACTGWVGEGSAPTSGTTTSVLFTLDEPSTLTWLWKTQHALATGVEPPGYGSVVIEGTEIPAAGWYDSGASVTLRAIAGPGAQFDRWSGALTGADNPAALSLDSPASATAHFLLEIAVRSPRGNPSPPAGLYPLAPGSNITVQMPDPVVAGPPGVRYVCTGWLGEGAVPASGAGTSVTFTLDQPSTITWQWKTQHALSTYSNPLRCGTVVIEGTGTPAAGWYDAGAAVEVRAMPVPGARFGHWSGGLTGTSNPTTVLLDAPRLVTAHYVTDLVVQSPYGSPVPAPGLRSYTSGTLVTAQVPTPTVAGPAGTRYVCTGWTGQGAVPTSGNTTSVTFTLDQPSTISWQWKTQYALSTYSNPPRCGTVVIEGTETPAAGWYDAGDAVELRAVPVPGARFRQWSGGLTGANNPATVVLDAPRLLTAHYATDLFVRSDYGSPTPAPGLRSYTSGTLVTAQVPDPTVAGPAATRYICTGWMGQGAVPSSGNATSVTFTLDQPSTITWLWKTQYALSASASPPELGAVVLDGTTTPAAGWYDAGENLTLRALPAPSARFDYWSEDLTGADNPAPVRLDAPRSVKAHFTIPDPLAAREWDRYDIPARP